MNIIFNGTHVSDTPIIGVRKYFEGRYIEFFYAVGKNVNKGIELYFYENLVSPHPYTSRRYSEDKIPVKYKEIYNTLKSNLPKINELPSNPLLTGGQTVKVEIEAFM